MAEIIAKALGKLIAEAVAERLGYDLFLIASPIGTRCLTCGKVYSSSGWLNRHYIRTEHWLAPKVGDSRYIWRRIGPGLEAKHLMTEGDCQEGT